MYKYTIFFCVKDSEILVNLFVTKQPMMDKVDRDAATKDLKDTGEIVNRECVTIAHSGKDFFTCNND